MCDCLIIGFNDSDFQKYADMVRSFGVQSGAYQDLDLAMIKVDGRYYRALEILSRYRREGRGEHKPWHNVDFIWPAITYLGTYLTNRGFTFDYVNLFHFEKEKLKARLLENNVLSVAITTTLYVIAEPIIEIVEFIRQFNKKTKILIGGPYIGNQFLALEAADLQRTLKLLGADIYVDSTEGEHTLVSILKALKCDGKLEGIPNIAYRQGDQYFLTPKVPESNPLDATPINYAIFPKEELGEMVSLRTAKSCPFACSFCGFPQRAGSYRYTPVAFVEQELNKLRDLGYITTLTFLDDTFNVPLKRFEEILRMMIRNKYGFHWNSFLRSDHVTEETVGLMAEAGCEGVFLGVESGSDTILKMMNKTARKVNYQNAIPWLKSAGIFTHANFIIGFPGETLETFKETYDFVEQVRPDSFRAQLWYADPRTPVWKKTLELGIQGSGFNWSHATMDCRAACHLIEKMFLSIQNSIWLPQNGFELWSIYYLQRKGMTRSQIKRFVNSFNALIREKLVRRAVEMPSPVLLRDLINCCLYDSIPQPIFVDSKAYSPAEYCQAEVFWKTEFGHQDCIRPVLGEGDPKSPPALMYFKLSPELSASVCQMRWDIGKVLLGGFALAIGAWKQCNCVRILMRDNGSEPLPLNVVVAGASLIEVLPQVAAKIEGARRWANYSLYFLSNRTLMEEWGSARPVIEFAYDVSVAGSSAGARPNTGQSQYPPSLEEHVKLRLAIMEVDFDIRARISYDRTCISRADVEQLVSILKSVLANLSGIAEIRAKTAGAPVVVSNLKDAL